MTTKLFVSALTLALLSSATPAFAGSTVTPDPVVTNAVSAPTATQLVEKFGDKLDQYITALASKAGVAADHFYPVFVKQQRITGIFEAFLMLVGASVGVFFLRSAYTNMSATIDSDDDTRKSRDKNYRKRQEAGMKATFGFVVGGVITVVSIIAILVAGGDSVGKVFNPEFSAVQSLVQMVK